LIDMTTDLKAVTPSYVREDDRGSFQEILNTGPWHTVISGVMRSGAILGNHYHQKTTVFLHLFDGTAEVHAISLDGEIRRNLRLSGGEGVRLEPNQAHAVRFLSDTRFLLLKSLPYQDDDPDTYPRKVLSRESACSGEA